MPDETISAALEREHHEIDAGIAAFLAKLDVGSVDPEPLNEALEALRRHIYLEERILFPPIRQGGLVMPLFVMMREHGEIWRTMDTLTEALAGDGDADRLRAGCKELLKQLEAHNMKEEPVIYPHADTDLTAEQAAELDDFIKTGLTPDSWVCQEAG
ncbi:MAG TPA: hemerythrin domain-containing protein [Mycobacterium sp.]|nr:hemerythrin domain-containing protein [Mycobacterium sp.]